MPDRDRTETPQRDSSKQPIVGRDVPDESKERHTEIAVEEGKRTDEASEDER
ncbi:MAG TPA: hypothetical protein VME41_09230 [Stellaceae bacterium]|nr:hypothetical protein [Stellaceae bacterium]